MKNNNIKFIVLFSIFITIFSFGLFNIVSALNFGRSDGRGYFYDHYEGAANDASSNVLPPINPAGEALPTTGSNIVNSVDTFIGLLKRYYSSGTRQEIVGSAFIVNTMLGRTAPGSGVSGISFNDWDSLTNRLNGRQAAGKIRWFASRNTCTINSYYQKNNQDDAFYTRNFDCMSEPAIEILDDSNQVIYTLDRMCANPMGVLIPITESWSITPTVSVDKTTVSPGGTITWTHTVVNNGPDKTNKDINYKWRRSGGISGEGGNGTVTSGWINQGSRQFTSTYTVPSNAAAGTQLCSATVVNPGSPSGTTDVVSAASCVTVGSLPASNPCRPLYMDTPATFRDYDGRIVSMYATITNTQGGASRTYGGYSSAQRINVTNPCTTGSVWNVRYWTNSYPYQLTRHSRTTSYSCGSGKSKSTCYRTIVWYGPDKDYRSYSASGPNLGPCYDYSLNTSVNSFGSKREAGESVSIIPTVTSKSYTRDNFTSFYNIYNTHTQSKSTNWQVTSFTVPPNATVPTFKSNANSTTDPCNYFDPTHRATCSVIYSGNTVFNPSGIPANSLARTYSVPDVLAGTKVCFAFSIKPMQSDPMNTTSSWNASEPWSHAQFDPITNCIIVVKEPKVQIWGGDLSTGGYTQTSTSVKSGNIFGSWVEYAIFARGSIGTTASASAFAIPNNRTNVSDYSKLSFTNTCSGGLPGCYVSSRTIPDVVAGFSGGSSISGTTLTANSLDSGIYTADSISLNANTLDKGKSIIIKATGTVYITGNQIYNDGPYTKTSDLPQLIITANRIVINSNVTRVDAWLVATNSSRTGRIDTCNSGGRSINECNIPLTVNGPVMTDKLYLYRTAGSDPGAASGNPAEVFNLRADAYLWAAARSFDKNSIQTVRTTDIPPRN